MKILFSSILVIICHTCVAQSFSDQDIQRIKTYCNGEFVTDSSETGSDTRRKLSIKPIWEKRKDGIWFFVKMLGLENKDVADNFFIWHFYRENGSVFLLQLLQFKEKEKAAGMGKGTLKDADLFLYDLRNMIGCELYLVKDKAGSYLAESKGKDCYPGVANAEYMTYSAGFNKNSIAWGAKGFDKQDKQVLALSENYLYKRIVTLKKKR